MLSCRIAEVVSKSNPNRIDVVEKVVDDDADSGCGMLFSVDLLIMKEVTNRDYEKRDKKQ